MWMPREAVKPLLLPLDLGILLPGPGTLRSLNMDVEMKIIQAQPDVSSGSLEQLEQSPGIMSHTVGYYGKHGQN